MKQSKKAPEGCFFAVEKTGGFFDSLK